MTVISLDVWQPMPNLWAEFDALVTSIRQIDERFGARVSTWRPIAGVSSEDMIVYSTEFDSMASYQMWADRTAADAEHCSYRSRLQQLGPTVSLGRSAAEVVNRVVVDDDPRVNASSRQFGACPTDHLQSGR